MPLAARYDENSLETNCGPLSVVMACGIPHREKSCSRKSTIAEAVTEPIGTTSGHFEWRSYTTTRNRWWWGTEASSPQMSICKCSHGLVDQSTGCKGGGAGAPVLPLSRQGAQSRTRASSSLSIPGHQTKSRHLCFSLTTPTWPSCAIVSTCPLRDRGMTARCPRAMHDSPQHVSSALTREKGVRSALTRAGQPFCM